MAVINDFYWASHKCLFVITGSHFFVVWRNRRGTNLDTKAQVSSGINGCEWTKEGLPWQKILTLCNLICLGSNTLKAEFKATSQEKISWNPASASKAASEPDSQGWAKWLLRSSRQMFQDCIVSRERSIRCCNFRLTPGYCSVAGCSHYNEKNDDDTQSCRYNNEPIEDTMSMLANQEDPVTCCLLPEARLTHCASCWKVG